MAFYLKSKIINDIASAIKARCHRFLAAAKDKDNYSFIISIAAIIFSALGFAYTVYQGNVNISRERYEFWRHVTASLKRQESTAVKIYPLLYTQVVQSMSVIHGIHGDKVECSSLMNVGGNFTSLNGMLGYVVKSKSLGRLENGEQYGLQDVVLEDGNLANALSIRGWNHFISDNNYSTKWWDTLAWDTMQLGLFPSSWGLKCAMKTKKDYVTEIVVSKKSIETFKNDIKTASLDDTYIGDRITPNIIAIKNIEALNSQGVQPRFGPLRSIFGPINKADLKANSGIKIMTYITNALDRIAAGTYAKAMSSHKGKS